MTKRMIYQVYVGKPSVLYDTCVQSAAVYCAKHNIDHVIHMLWVLWPKETCPVMQNMRQK